MSDKQAQSILESRVVELERQLASLRGSPKPRAATPGSTASRRRRRVRLGVMLGLVLAAMPALLVASHEPFTDVPDSYIFHQEIGDLYQAGIVTGTAPTTYSPNSNVTRGSMSAFIHRGLGRAATSEDQIGITTDSLNHKPTSLTIKTGGVFGQDGFLVVTASATLLANAGACPCTIAVRPAIGSDDPGFWEFQTVTDTASPYFIGSVRAGSATNSWVFPVTSGANYTVDLLAAVDMTAPGTGASLQGHLTAIYVPLGSTGGATLSAPEFPGVEYGLEP